MDPSKQNQPHGGHDARTEERIRELEKMERIVMESLGPEGWEQFQKRWEENTREIAGLQPETNQLRTVVRGLKNQALQIIKGFQEKEKLIIQLKKRVVELEANQDDSQMAIEGRLAHSLLTEIDWMLVLEKLSSGKDLWSCYHTCRQFEVILHPSKVGWAFELALPHFYRLLSGSDMLKCRMVCRRWRDGVNHFLENHPSIQPHNDDDIDPKLLNFVYPVREKRIGDRNALRFRNRMDFVDLPEYQNGQDWNPFVGRYAVLALGEINVIDWEEPQHGEADNWWEALYPFLESFGKEILYLNVISDSHQTQRNGNLNQRLESLSQFLTIDLPVLVPNIRKLRLHSDHYSHNLYVPLDPELPPFLPKLETIETGNGMDDTITKSLIERHHFQLRKLTVTGYAWRQIRQLEWPNLEELQVTSGQYYYDQENTYQDLHGVRMPSLRKLVLQLPARSESMLSLMEVISELCSTSRLTMLHLKGSCYGERYPHVERFAAAPASLKTLQIENFWHYENDDYDGILTTPPFDFILVCFPFVENIQLILCHREAALTPLQRLAYNRDEIVMQPRHHLTYEDPNVDLSANTFDFLQINRFMYRGQMYKSNIWEFLPMLKVFSFQYDVYTRAGYEKYSRHH